MKTFLITGGCGFIGSALCRYLVQQQQVRVINVDKLTYAANQEALHEVQSSPLYTFAEGDICDRQLLDTLFRTYQPDGVFHLAAESHVDRSIDAAGDFIHTNITGTYTLLEATRDYCSRLQVPSAFRFLHVSTDEVYGDLPPELHHPAKFTEDTPYAPSSPYSASKAAADHLVRAWHRTYQLPILISNCSNNYGPYQHPEKLIPLIISRALQHQPLPIYGSGSQIRDWLYVDDHIAALWRIWNQGRIGQSYNIGGDNERTNLDVVHTICAILEQLAPDSSPPDGYASLITHVTDRPGHDLRYAIDASKLQRDLDWHPAETFDTGIRKTVEWYLQV